MPDEDLSNWRFENEFIIPTTAMYIIRTHPFIARNKLWLFQFLSMTVVNASCLFCLCNSIFRHDVKKGNYVDVSKNFAVLIVCFNSNFKYYAMLYYQKSLAGLIQTIDRDYELAKHFNEAEKNIVLSYSQKGNKVCKFWIVVAVLTSCIFPGKAFILMAYYYLKGEGQLVPMFDMTWPNFIESYKEATWAFCGIFSLCFFFDGYAFFVYLGFEPLIPIFNLHVCGQLELLSLRISKVLSGSKNEQEVHQKLRDINVKLQELYRFIDDVQNDFMMIMEFNMKTTTFISPCNAFQIVEDFRTNNVINVEFIALLSAAIIHFLTPCYFSDVLMESSEKFRQAIYSCGWESCRYISVRKTVLLMITRTSRPFSISTIFYFICLDTFSTMCRQAYAIFNLMTAAWT